MLARDVLMKLKPGFEVELTNCDAACPSLGPALADSHVLAGLCFAKSCARMRPNRKCDSCAGRV